MVSIIWVMGSVEGQDFSTRRS